MLELKGLDVDVVINLENNIYQFECWEAATGRTRLYTVVRTYQRAGYNVVAYSYNNLLDGIDLCDMLKKSKPALLVIDRYDMFSDKYHDAILSLCETCIVLIDSKEILEFVDYYSTCSIKMTPSRIEVER